MLKKIFDAIKKYHRIIFPIITAIFYKLNPQPPFEDYNFTLDLLFTISLIISVVSIAIWLKKYPWIYYPCVYFANMGRWYMQNIALLMFPIING